MKERYVDILIAVNMIYYVLTKRIRKVILFSGDSDIVPAIRMLKEMNIIVELYYFQNNSLSPLLLAEVGVKNTKPIEPLL